MRQPFTVGNTVCPRLFVFIPYGLVYALYGITHKLASTLGCFCLFVHSLGGSTEKLRILLYTLLDRSGKYLVKCGVFRFGLFDSVMQLL